MANDQDIDTSEKKESGEDLKVTDVQAADAPQEKESADKVKDAPKKDATKKHAQSKDTSAKDSASGKSAAHKSAAMVYDTPKVSLKDKKVFGKIPAIWAIITPIVVVVLVIGIIVAVGFANRPGSLEGFFNGDYTRSEIASVSIYNSKTVTAIEDTAAELKFNYGEPIILAYEFNPPKDTGDSNKEVVYNYTITKKGKDDPDRKGSMPIKVSTDDNSVTKNKRYLSVVSSERSALVAGKYEFVLKDSDGKSIAKRTFTIEGEPAEAPTENQD
jgi:hypothetical protein